MISRSSSTPSGKLAQDIERSVSILMRQHSSYLILGIDFGPAEAFRIGSTDLGPSPCQKLRVDNTSVVGIRVPKERPWAECIQEVF
jgi:hypothetical protein